jgi:hypothetical protein
MYQWLLFLHIGSVLVFMLLHGVQVTVTWKKRWEPDPDRNQALFEALPSGVRTLRLPFAAVVASGLILVAFLGIWTHWWIWLSLLVLGVIWLTMWRWGAGYYNSIQAAAEQAVASRGTPDESQAAAAFRAERLSWRVPAMTVVGFGGIAAILWLMVFKPF